jgi:broad specificity phosphatase PhoE
LRTSFGTISAIWHQQLRAGRRHDEIEEALEAARVRLNPLAALALTGDASKGGDVLPRLNAWSRRYRDTYQTLNKGVHVTHDGDLRLLIADAKGLVTKIRAALS